MTDFNYLCQRNNEWQFIIGFMLGIMSPFLSFCAMKLTKLEYSHFMRITSYFSSCETVNSKESPKLTPTFINETPNEAPKFSPGEKGGLPVFTAENGDEITCNEWLQKSSTRLNNIKPTLMETSNKYASNEEINNHIDKVRTLI